MQIYQYKDIGVAGDVINHTSGTISLGACRRIYAQTVLDTNSGYEVAVKPSQSATATCSKASCVGVVSNNGTQECNLGPGNWYLAYRVYNGATAATGGAADRIVIQKQG